MSNSRRFRLVCLAAGIGLCAFSPACDGNDDPYATQYSSARLIDRVCNAGAYSLSGSAEVTSGLTADSCGFVIGPEPGAVYVDAGSALVKVNDEERANWTAQYFQEMPDGKALSNPPNTKLEVVDLRVSYTPPYGGGCGVARVR